MVLLLQHFHEMQWRQLSMLQHAPAHKTRKKNDAKSRVSVV
jgi:hypothetical protein